MKSLVTLLSAGIVCLAFSSSLFAKGENDIKLRWSPEVYSELKSAYKEQPAKLPKTKVAKHVESQILKYLALDGDSRVTFVKQASQCSVLGKQLKPTEINAINKFVRAKSAGNLEEAMKHVKWLSSPKGKSKLGKIIAKEINEGGSNDPGSDVTAASESSDNETGVYIGGLAKKVITAETVVMGTIAGASSGSAAGPGGTAGGAAAGAAAGAAVGIAVGEVVEEVYKGIFNWLLGRKGETKKKKEDGIMVGPNGEDCTPPFSLIILTR